MFTNSGPRHTAIKAKVLQLKIGNLTEEEVTQMQAEKDTVRQQLADFDAVLKGLPKTEREAMTALFHSDIVELLFYYRTAALNMSPCQGAVSSSAR